MRHPNGRGRVVPVQMWQGWAQSWCRCGRGVERTHFRCRSLDDAERRLREERRQKAALTEEVQKLTVHRTRLAVPGWLGEPTRLEDPSPAKTVKIRAGDSNTKQDQPAPSSKQGAPSRVQPAAQGQTLKKVQTGSWRARTGGMGPRLAAHGPRSAY